MHSKILYLLTRTPLHVGAGASVGAIDQPVQRERHTGFPIIPGSSLKGSFADQWPVQLRNEKDDLVRITSKKVGDKYVIEQIDSSGAAWLFGSDDAHVAFAGSLIFSEARMLAFPIRSAKGSYAWITCPLILQRAVRDGVFGASSKNEKGEEQNAVLKAIETLNEPLDEAAIFKPNGPLALTTKFNGADVHQIVLEEYCFSHANPVTANVFGEGDLAGVISKLITDTLFLSIQNRLVILSNGMMSHFATTACEVAQHVRISDETGTAEGTGLFNQENVPADTLFYSVLSAADCRAPRTHALSSKTAIEAIDTFTSKLAEKHNVFQFGGDASTGLGFCTVTPSETKGA